MGPTKTMMGIFFSRPRKHPKAQEDGEQEEEEVWLEEDDFEEEDDRLILQPGLVWSDVSLDDDEGDDEEFQRRIRSERKRLSRIGCYVCRLWPWRPVV